MFESFRLCQILGRFRSGLGMLLVRSRTPCIKVGSLAQMVKSISRHDRRSLVRIRYDPILIYKNAGLAQLAEQLICNQQVVGSNPMFGSIFIQEDDYNV